MNQSKRQANASSGSCDGLAENAVDGSVLQRILGPALAADQRDKPARADLADVQFIAVTDDADEDLFILRSDGHDGLPAVFEL